MSYPVILNSFRTRLAARLFSGVTFPKIGYIAFGNGGHNTDLTPKIVFPTQTTLNNQLLVKPVTLSQPTVTSVIGSAVLSTTELTSGVISEVALLDTDGNAIAIQNFNPISKGTTELTIALRINLL